MYVARSWGSKMSEVEGPFVALWACTERKLRAARLPEPDTQLEAKATKA
jgi:hypothetical protein